MKRHVSFLMIASFGLIVSVQHIHAEASSGLVGDLIEHVMQDPSERKPPLDGKLAWCVDHAQPLVNAYAGWQENNPKLAEASFLGAKIAVAGIRDAIIAASAAKSFTRSPVIIADAAILGAANGIRDAVIGEIKDRAVNAIAHEQIEAMMHDAAAKLAPGLMKLDSQLTPEKAVYAACMGSALLVLTSEQFSKFIKGVPHTSSSQFKLLADEAKHAFLNPHEALAHTIIEHIPHAAFENAKKMPQFEAQQDPRASVDGNVKFPQIPEMPFAHNQFGTPVTDNANTGPANILMHSPADSAATSKSKLPDIQTLKAEDQTFLKAVEPLSSQLPASARLSELLTERRLEMLKPIEQQELPVSSRASEILQHRMDYLQPMQLQNNFANMQPMMNHDFQQQFPAAYQPIQQLPFGQQQFNVQPMQPVQMPHFENANPGGYYNMPNDIQNLFNQNFRN